jgi:hypothetical protein
MQQVVRQEFAKTSCTSAPSSCDRLVWRTRQCGFEVRASMARSHRSSAGAELSTSSLPMSWLRTAASKPHRRHRLPRRFTIPESERIQQQVRFADFRRRRSGCGQAAMRRRWRGSARPNGAVGAEMSRVQPRIEPF